MPKIRLVKVHTTRYRDRTGTAVPKGTRGAKKVVELSDKWYAEWRVNGQKQRKPLATDKTVAQKMLGDLILEMERGNAGMVDAFKVFLDQPITEHVADYLSSLKAQEVSDKHFAERSRCLLAVVQACNARILADLTADKVDRYLSSLDTSARTRDTYRAAALGFCNFLVSKDRLDRNPLVKTTKPKGEVVRERRALSPEQLQRILDTTRTRPVLEFSTIRRGERKGQQAANLQDRTRQRLEQLGRERALIYKTAVFTGLRRGEIAALRVCHLHLDAEPFPFLNLPARKTKGKKGHQKDAKLLLVPAFAEELRLWIADTRKQPEDALFSVRNEMVKTLKADLKAAGIPFKDADGRAADFHSLRMTANTMLGDAGIPPKVRMLFMRHSDIRLTMQTYDDASRNDLQGAVKALEKLNLQ
jgi:integrase